MADKGGGPGTTWQRAHRHVSGEAGTQTVHANLSDNDANNGLKCVKNNVRPTRRSAPSRLHAVLAVGLQRTSCGTGGSQHYNQKDSIRIAAILVGSTVHKGQSNAHVRAVGKLYNDAVRFKNSAIYTGREFKPQNISVDGTNYRITLKSRQSGSVQGELFIVDMIVTASVRGAKPVNVMWLPVGAREGSWKQFPAIARYDGPWNVYER